MTLGAHEAVYWSRSVSNPYLAAVAVAATASAGVVAAQAGNWLGAVASAVGVVVAYLLFSWRIVIDANGMQLVLPWQFLRLRLPLERMAAARAVSVQPLLRYGGWGVRLGFDLSVGLIVRGPEALELRFLGRLPRLVITMAGAGEAAELLMALKDRRLCVE